MTYYKYEFKGVDRRLTEVSNSLFSRSFLTFSVNNRTGVQRLEEITSCAKREKQTKPIAHKTKSTVTVKTS